MSNGRLDEQRLRGDTKALIEDIIAIERADKFKQRQTLFHFLRDLVHSLRWHDVIARQTAASRLPQASASSRRSASSSPCAVGATAAPKVAPERVVRVLATQRLTDTCGVALTGGPDL